MGDNSTHQIYYTTFSVHLDPIGYELNHEWTTGSIDILMFDSK